MGLAAGTKLGPYEIASPLGAGGMGEVYRARDTRLDRAVAIKILPEHLAAKPDAAERFEREARAISSLNHPNICQLYDVGSQGGTRYLVMELLEGETLADRLRRGPLPIEQVLRYGAEISRGLAAAHHFGVVHRDLKPGNIMLTKAGAKLMDFGLAKGMAAANPVSAELTATMTSPHPTPLTTQGTIVGTFQYMAPEQVEGKEADARSDIFSLGSVLYEMASGRRAFDGKTLVSVAAAILEKEPEPIRTVQPLTPPALERLIRKSMAKDPDDRWQNASDLASELRWIAEGGEVSGTHVAPIVSKRGMSERVAWIVASLGVSAALALAGLHFSSREPKQVVRSQIDAAGKLQFNFVGDNSGPPEISPDGTRLVFSAKLDGKALLYLRSIGKLSLDPLPGTEDAVFPFWSPDSRSIAFFAGGKLKRVDIAGGPAVIVCDAPLGRGGAWGSSGIILFAPHFNSPLFQVPASGGTPVAATRLDAKFTTHRWPNFMPDGQHFVYLAANHSSPSGPNTALFLGSLDGKTSLQLMASRSNAIYASGYLLYVRDSTLVARALDYKSGQFTGQETVLNDDVQVDASVWRGSFTASDQRTLVYQPGAATTAMTLSWRDRSGKETSQLSVPDSYHQIELSPDDKKIVVSLGEPLAALWTLDLERNTRTRLTFGNENDSNPVWSPDGSRIAFTRGGGVASEGGLVLLSKASNGAGPEKQVLQLDPANGLQQALCDWSPDGRYLIFRTGTTAIGTGFDLWVVPLFGDGKPFAYETAAGDQTLAQFSPDGRWVSYVSTETGRSEIFVAPFPPNGAKYQVSTSGGTMPRWRRDGKELFFGGLGSSRLMAAAVSDKGPNFEVNGIRPLFDTNNMSPNIASAQYDVTADGQRFLAITTGDAGTLPLTLVQNWTAELKK